MRKTDIVIPPFWHCRPVIADGFDGLVAVIARSEATWQSLFYSYLVIARLRQKSWQSHPQPVKDKTKKRPKTERFFIRYNF